MAATTEPNNQHTGTGVLYEAARYLVRSVVYTPVHAFGLLFIAFPYGIVILGAPETQVAAYAVLAVLGLSVYVGQLEALDTLDTEDDALHWFEELVYVGMSIIYYNSSITLAVGIGLFASNLGYPGVGALGAFFLPVADLWLSREHHLGILANMLTVTSNSIERGSKTMEGVRVRARMVASIFAGLDNIVPPILGHLLVSQIGKRRLD